MCIPQPCETHKDCPFFEKCERGYHYCREIQCTEDDGKNKIQLSLYQHKNIKLGIFLK